MTQKKILAAVAAIAIGTCAASGATAQNVQTRTQVKARVDPAAERAAHARRVSAESEARAKKDHADGAYKRRYQAREAAERKAGKK